LTFNKYFMFDKSEQRINWLLFFTY
jgi:hypothetical protein